MTATYRVEALLGLAEDGIAGQHRRFRRWRNVWFASLSVLTAGLVALGVVQLYQTWQGGGDWLHFWSSFVTVIPTFPAMLRLLIVRDGDARLYVPVRELHAAILAGDERRAPLAVEQPAAWDAAWAPHGDAAGTFRRVRTGPAVVAFSLAIADALLGVPLGIVLLVMQSSTLPDADLRVAGAITLSASVGLLIALVALGFWLRRRMRVHVDEGGVWWRAVSGRKVRFDWQQARAFYRVHSREGDAHTLRLAYFLDAGDAVLAWRAKGAASRAASDQLVALLGARTRLPLRDVSVEAQRIALEASHPRPRPRNEAGPSKADGRARKAEARERLPRWAWLIPLVLVGVFVATALGAQVLQPRYYGNLYAQARAHTPVYADSLAALDADWPSEMNEDFANGVYQLTYDEQTDGTVFALAPRSFGDGLYEVSVRTDSGDEYSGAGMVACCRLPADDLIAFQETPSGEWWQMQASATSRWDVNYSDAHLGDSAAIHRGVGVWNRVAVLVQGSRLTFFVNGEYVTGTTLDAPPARVGLFLDATTGSASFRDFTVYPLK